jgi:uncharacterized protein (TIGR00369 family)
MRNRATVNHSRVVNRLVNKVLASKPPIAELIGFDVEEIGDGRSVASLQSGPQHANPIGTLHGGVLCDLTDAAMGMAFASTLEPDESFTTISLTINFFRPVWQLQLRAEARVTSRGKNIGYIECEVTDEAGKRVAKSTSTCFVLRASTQRVASPSDIESSRSQSRSRARTSSSRPHVSPPASRSWTRTVRRARSRTRTGRSRGCSQNPDIGKYSEIAPE